MKTGSSDAPAEATPCDRVLTRPMRVVARGAGWLRLQGERDSACKSCAAKSGCGVNAVADVLGLEPPTIKVAGQGAPAAQVGEDVMVSIDGPAFLKAASLAYLLPPAAIVLAVLIAEAAGFSDLKTAGLALVAFIASLTPIWSLDRGGRLLDTLSVETKPEESGPTS